MRKTFELRSYNVYKDPTDYNIIMVMSIIRRYRGEIIDNYNLKYKIVQSNKSNISRYTLTPDSDTKELIGERLFNFNVSVLNMYEHIELESEVLDTLKNTIFDYAQTVIGTNIVKDIDTLSSL